LTGRAQSGNDRRTGAMRALKLQRWSMKRITTRSDSLGNAPPPIPSTSGLRTAMHRTPSREQPMTFHLFALRAVCDHRAISTVEIRLGRWYEEWAVAVAIRRTSNVTKSGKPTPNKNASPTALRLLIKIAEVAAIKPRGACPWRIDKNHAAVGSQNSAYRGINHLRTCVGFLSVPVFLGTPRRNAM
jgi:hypothetical protein